MTMQKVAAQLATPQMFTTAGIALVVLFTTHSSESERIQLAGIIVAGVCAAVHAITEAWIKIQKIRATAHIPPTEGAEQ